MAMLGQEPGELLRKSVGSTASTTFRFWFV